MREKNEQDLYRTLSDTQQLLDGLDPTGERYSLESILKEFGTAAAEEPAAEETPVSVKEETAAAAEAPAEETPPAPVPVEKKTEREPPAAKEPEKKAKVLTFPGKMRAPEPEEPAAPQEETEPEERSEQQRQEDLAFESLVAETVGSVLGEERQEAREKTGPLKKLRAKRSAERAAAEEEFYDEEAEEARRRSHEEEPDPAETHTALRREYTKLKKEFRLSLLPATLGLLLTVLGELGIISALRSTSLMAIVQTALLALSCLCGVSVFRRAVTELMDKCFTAELLTAVSCAAAFADGCSAAFGAGERSAAPLCLVSMFAVSFALAGRMLETRGRKDSFRLRSVGEPGGVVAESPDGILKQKGKAAGFTHCVDAENAAERWQSVLLPLIFAAAIIFTALATVGQGRGSEFFWCLSVLFTAANSFTLPLCYALPYARVARRLYHSGVAVAGWLGARLISRSRRMILTDRDLFPEGTVHLNGIKIYGEEIGKVVSYAASLAHRSGSGIATLFDSLLASEGATLQKVEEFAYSDHGGYSAVIHGETTLLGTEKFLRRNNVTIPQGMKLKNGLLLSLDGRLAAAFAVKYPQVSSTEWAIHSLRRMGVAPVLASRDPNLTPALLKQRFGTDAKAVYPTLSERLTLSDPQRQRPGLMGAVLYREGLMPYAEAVVASRRLCRVTRQLTALAMTGSVLSLLLCFYLVFVGAYGALTPLMLTAYQLLWSFGGVLIGLGTDRY